jgi:hypothetical protein
VLPADRPRRPTAKIFFGFLQLGIGIPDPGDDEGIRGRIRADLFQELGGEPPVRRVDGQSGDPAVGRVKNASHLLAAV